MREFERDVKVVGRLARVSGLSAVAPLVVCGLCLFMISCSKFDMDLESYFSRLAAGKDQVKFPYKISNKDTVCVLQAYQSRVGSKSVLSDADLINVQLNKASFRGEEGAWVLVRFSEGTLFLHRIDRYKSSLSSPLDSDHDEWIAEDGRKSAECATGAQLKFAVFINQVTGERRVGIVSTGGEGNVLHK